ncbi:DNA-binding protein [Kingella kingae]|uniref:DNA-binding protein n=1 Tax=Kingella kingae TaxID=504 RepID=UPI00254B1C57|nr:DNA-binding protein [Kingella kingae]MDK4650071.1 DNA-binding protein [Kingella kingae]
MSWVLSSDLIGLAGMPTTSRGITKKATTENWTKRRRQGVKGNVFEYEIASMPAEVQIAIAQKQMTQIMQQTPTLPEQKQPEKVSKKSQKLGLIPVEEGLQHLDNKQRAVADARLVLVGYVLMLHRSEQLKLGIKDAVRYVVEQIKADALPDDKKHLVAVANARTGDKRQGLGFSTLYRWVRTYQAVKGDGEALRIGRILALAERKSRQHKPWMRDFLRYYQNPNKPTILLAMKKMAVDYAKWGKVMPSYDVVQKTLQDVPPFIRNRGRVMGSEYKSRYLTHIRRDWTTLAPNDVWVGDGHSFKAKVRSFQNGQPKTLEFTMVIDGCSGAIMGWSVSLAENTSAVADALRCGFRDYGLPLVYYSDNGAGQTAKLLDDETLGLFARLNIEHLTGIPGNPMGRARIERKWKDTAIALAREYGTYQGKDADREAVRKRNVLLDSAWNDRTSGQGVVA